MRLGRFGQALFGDGPIAPFACHGGDLVADSRIDAFLRQVQQAFRLMAAILRFCFTHWGALRWKGNGHPLIGVPVAS